ncbi:MAG: hypothetical protein ACLFUW_00635 [Bacteroidales bacterium]
MKVKLFVLSLLIYAPTIVAQEYVPDEEELDKFFTTETKVVLRPNPISTYNPKIKDAVESNWEITEYDFLEYNKFDEMRKKPEYSFLTDNIVVFEKDKTKARYRFLSVLLGERTRRLEDMPTIVAVPLAYKEVDEEYWNYKLEVLVRFIQNHIKLMKENPDIISDNIFDYYNDNMEDISEKTLYLIKEELAEDVDTREEIEQYYPYDFELVTREDIEKAIKEKDENVVFLHKVGPQGSRLRARCYKILIGAKDADFYYFDYHNVVKGKRPDGFLKKDFRKLKRKARGGLF